MFGAGVVRPAARRRVGRQPEGRRATRPSPGGGVQEDQTRPETREIIRRRRPSGKPTRTRVHHPDVAGVHARDVLRTRGGSHGRGGFGAFFRFRKPLYGGARYVGPPSRVSPRTGRGRQRTSGGAPRPPAVLEMPGAWAHRRRPRPSPGGRPPRRGPPAPTTTRVGGGSSPGGGSPLHGPWRELGEQDHDRPIDTRGSGARRPQRARDDELARRVRAVEDGGGGGGVGGVLGRQARRRRKVMRAAGLTKGGPAMKAFTDRLVDWQLRIPGVGGGGVREKHRRGGQGRVQGGLRQERREGSRVNRTEPRFFRTPTRRTPTTRMDEDDSARVCHPASSLLFLFL